MEIIVDDRENSLYAELLRIVPTNDTPLSVRSERLTLGDVHICGGGGATSTPDILVERKAGNDLTGPVDGDGMGGGDRPAFDAIALRWALG